MAVTVVTLHVRAAPSGLAYGGAVSAPHRPVHLRPRSLGLVWLGGSLGTAARYAVAERVPPLRELPLGTLLVNVGGAFLLGLLLERLLRAGADVGRRRDLRLLAGTGFLGGFTTYSALATDAAGLLAADHPGRAAAYGLGTLLLGGLASLLGLGWGARSRRGERS
jgi:fluoride exporter